MIDPLKPSVPQAADEQTLLSDAGPMSEPIVFQPTAPSLLDASRQPLDRGPDASIITYEDFSLPEGLQSEAEILQSFKDLASSCGLSQSQAQNFVDLQSRLAQRQHQAWVEQHARWAEDAQNDPEYGGGQFWHNLSITRAALSTFASPSFVQVMNETGLGNHPEVIRTFYRIGLAMVEDGRPVLNGRARQTDPLAYLYPSMTPDGRRA